MKRLLNAIAVVSIVVVFAFSATLLTSRYTSLATAGSRPQVNTGPRAQVKSGQAKSTKKAAPSQRTTHEKSERKSEGGEGSSTPKKKSGKSGSHGARTEFMKQTGYPEGRPGYEVDYIDPLECGGADDAINMQWVTTEEFEARRAADVNCPEPSLARPPAADRS